MRNRLVIFALCCLSLAAFAQRKTNDAPPKLLPWSQQIAVREQWIAKRHAMLLDMMRRHGIDMWIVVNEEFHDDPMSQFVATPRVLTGNRDFFVFIDTGDKGLRKLAVTGYSEENLQRFFESPDEPRPADQVLPELFQQYQPKKIGLSIGGRRGPTRSLTHDTYMFLSEKMGPEATKRFVSAADLIEEYLDTRLPEEFDTYTQMVELTANITRRALSNEVITPGKTTVGDVRRWLYDALWENRVGTWFQPDLRVQRKGSNMGMSRGFLAVAKEDVVIQRGDLVHIDFGISYMGLHTDWQKMAYILREGEKDVPPGLKRAIANTNALQDSVMSRSRPGKLTGEIYNEAMADMKQRGIEAKIYSHAIGNHGHGVGPTIDFRAAQAEEQTAAKTPAQTPAPSQSGSQTNAASGTQPAPPPGAQAAAQTGATPPDRVGMAKQGADSPREAQERFPRNKPLRAGSYISIELNTLTPVPEWDGQKVFVMMEDDAYLTDTGYKFFRPRQEQFFLVK